MKTLALVIVAKNEEKGLQHCIESCRPFVDKVYVSVDDSSSDKTEELARQFADEVTIFKWNDNFAEARNLAHQNVQEDYILFLDGHEYLARCDRLQEALDLGMESLLVTVRMESGVEFPAPRLYEAGLQFVGAVHEQISAKKTARYNTLVIQHDRLDGQAKEAVKIRDEQRDEQVPRIMGAELKENPRNVRASFHLLLHAQSKGDHKKALYYAKRYLKYSKDPSQRWYVYYACSLSFISLGRKFRAYWAMCMAEREEPERWENEKMKGLYLFDSGKYEKALTCLVNSFNENKEDFLYKPLPRDDAGTWNIIGECFYRRGVFDKACTAFELASQRCTEEKQKQFFLDRSKLMSEMLKGRQL